jgi:hypothetical protein
MELERDEFGTVSLDLRTGVLELRWTDATAQMTDQQFMVAMERFAGYALEHDYTNVIIDVTRFAHHPGPEVGLWRDEHIVPRYNDAGVKKFAFLVPDGAPGTVEAGSAPECEGAANFPTGYFDAREDILAWFAQG